MLRDYENEIRHSIMTLHPMQEIIAGWMYSELVGWSLATNRIIFKIGSLLQQQQIVLKVTTTQGQTISDVMDVYTKLQQQQTTEK